MAAPRETAHPALRQNVRRPCNSRGNSCLRFHVEFATLTTLDAPPGRASTMPESRKWRSRVVSCGFIREVRQGVLGHRADGRIYRAGRESQVIFPTVRWRAAPNM